jgi:hypothetical protein
MAVIPLVSNEDKRTESKKKRADYRREKREKEKEAKRQETEKSRKKHLTRKQIRDLKKETNLVRDLLGIISSYFPDLINQLKNVKDNRHKSYVKYDISVILIERILSGIFSFSSQRAMTRGLNNDNAIKNIAKFLKMDNLDELPHGDTMNDCFKKMDPDDMQSLIHKMVYRLLRRNTFNNSRIDGADWPILVDATEIFRSNKRHCEHCLFSRHKNKDGDVTRISYYHNVLEAKLVLNDSLVFSIQSEFIENEQPIPSEEVLFSREYSEPSKDKVKQDCETKAFYRLAAKLKAAFPKLPICIVTDSLYPSKGVFETCQRMGWHYIMRFKDGTIPILAKQFHDEAAKNALGLHERNGNKLLDYRFVNGLTYEGFTINAVELKDSSVKYPFLFITDYPTTLYNFRRIIGHGRTRWRIENEGFDRQKNHGYHLKHTFCRDYNAMKIHYFLIQVSHAISQLWEHSSYMKTLKCSLEELHEDLKIAFLTIVLTDADIDYVSMRKRIRLDHDNAA